MIDEGLIISKDLIINKMNSLGSQNKQFIFIINFNFDCAYIQELHKIDSKKIKFQIGTYSNYPFLQENPKNLSFQKFPLDYSEYLEKFNAIKKEIAFGNSFLLNLTFENRIETNWSLAEIFNFCKSKNKLFFDDQFVLFSPENFIEVKNGWISTYPMKGTIEAEIKNAKEIILHDEKESAEHATIVDLLRNDLSRVATEVHVKRYRYLDYIKTNQNNLIQVSSEICGKLQKSYSSHPGDLFANLLPAGSITGAPKTKTLQIISDTENHTRGYYTGVFGVYNRGEIVSAVMIRFIENKDSKFYYKSGGGITHLSNPLQEYQEMIDKIYIPV